MQPDPGKEAPVLDNSKNLIRVGNSLFLKVPIGITKAHNIPKDCIAQDWGEWTGRPTGRYGSFTLKKKNEIVRLTKQFDQTRTRVSS